MKRFYFMVALVCLCGCQSEDPHKITKEAIKNDVISLANRGRSFRLGEYHHLADDWNGTSRHVMGKETDQWGRGIYCLAHGNVLEGEHPRWQLASEGEDRQQGTKDDIMTPVFSGVNSKSVSNSMRSWLQNPTWE